MTRRHLGTGLGLLAGAFVLALTSHGPAPVLQVARFQGVVHAKHAPRHNATTRLPVSARLPHEHHHVVAGQRRNDPRSSSVRVETVSAHGGGPRSARRGGSGRERGLQRLFAVYYDANAPPARVLPTAGRHA